MAHVRQFESGATRNEDEGKIDPEGYLSPWVVARYCEYMRSHQQTPDGPRASDNWQLGIPSAGYMKSLWRHFLVAWRDYREGRINQDALCAILFNASGLLHEEISHGAVVCVARVVDGIRGPVK